MIVATFNTISWMETHNLIGNICPNKKHPEKTHIPTGGEKCKEKGSRAYEINSVLGIEVMGYYHEGSCPHFTVLLKCLQSLFLISRAPGGKCFLTYSDKYHSSFCISPHRRFPVLIINTQPSTK